MSIPKDREFGDFQTPINLARSIVNFLKANGICPSIVIEPTCGTGNFLVACVEAFGDETSYYGFDINPKHIEKAKKSLSQFKQIRFEISCDNFYDKDWRNLFGSFTSTLLIIGNPPWVTNSALAVMGSDNLPKKSNFQDHAGFAAKTGKANFDISEWMLIKLFESLAGKKAILAMLCKTGTARKVLKFLWEKGINVSNCSLHLIDATRHFGVSTDACLLVAHTGRSEQRLIARVLADLDFESLVSTFGLIGGELVADTVSYESLIDINGEEHRKWRSGIKHDAKKVMEFKTMGNYYVNGLGEQCDIEQDYLFPLLKSSDIANNRLHPSKYVLVTQRSTSEDTSIIMLTAPKTWKYLQSHSTYLDKRASIIYKKRSRFSIFGVGAYTFAPWKVGVSALYKNISFRVVGSMGDKPIVLDDTCYFIACQSYDEAEFFCSLLNSDVSKRFIASLVFLDAKRPVTIDILKRIDLKKLSERMGCLRQVKRYLNREIPKKEKQGVFTF